MSDVVKPEQVTEILEYVRQAADFSREQAPLIAQEILRWATVDAIIGLAICVPALLAGIWFLNLCYDRGERWVEDHGSAVAGLIVSACAVLFCSLGTLINAVTLVKLYVAPRLFLLEYLASHFS